MSSERGVLNLGRVYLADQVEYSGFTARRVRNIVILMAASLAIMMTGYGIVIPVFGKRLQDLGGGVVELGLMTMAFGAGQAVAAPFMGNLADRFGRLPLMLVGLAAFSATNVGFVLVESTAAFITLRTIEGILTAGLFPAVMGVVGDIAPPAKRARWVGVVMGSMEIGFIFGPVVGAVLYEASGFELPFTVSAAAGFIAFVGTAVMIPETRTKQVRRRSELNRRRESAHAPEVKESVWNSLPRPLFLFGMLLFLGFMEFFAFAFTEPEMIFYFYEDLQWTTIRFGVVIGAFGVTMMLGQIFLGEASDRFGRKPVILIGIIVSSTIYFGMAFVAWFWLMIVLALLSGLGIALIMPALNALFLDITSERHRSRVMGIKESVAALGGVAGPVLVVVVTAVTTPKEVFLIAGAITVATAAVTFVGLRVPHRAAVAGRTRAAVHVEERTLASQTVLRGLVHTAHATRQSRT